MRRRVVRHHGPPPAGAPCAIALRPGAREPEGPVSSVVLRAAPGPDPGLLGQPLLSCAALSYGDTKGVPDERTLIAAVLLDAHRPGTRPGRLPGLPGADDGQAVEIPAIGLSPFEPSGGDGPTATAQRRGNAWLVVRGRTRPEREALLRQLAVTLDGRPQG